MWDKVGGGGGWLKLPLSQGEELKREPLTLSLVLMSTEQSSHEEEVSFQDEAAAFLVKRSEKP